MDVVRVVIGIVCCNVRGVLMDGFIRGIVQRWCRSEIVLFASCVSRRSVSGRRDWNRINRRPHPAPHALLRQTGLKKYARQLTWFLRFFFFLSFFANWWIFFVLSCFLLICFACSGIEGIYPFRFSSAKPRGIWHRTECICISIDRLGWKGFASDETCRRPLRLSNPGKVVNTVAFIWHSAFACNNTPLYVDMMTQKPVL